MSRDYMDRRGFLVTGVAALAGACGWDGGRALRPVQGSAARFNDWLSEALLSHDRLAPKYDERQRSREFPAYHISAMTPAVDDLDDWTLDVGGLVRTPTRFSLDRLRELQRSRYTVKHHCVEGWSAIATWTGVPLSAIVEIVGLGPEARYVRFDSFDAGYYSGWDLKSALHPETILAYEFNDSDLTPDYGAPLRVYAPHKLGYKLAKYLTRVTFTAEKPGGYWEDKGYPWFGGV